MAEQNGIGRDLALRLARAAKALPGVEVGAFVHALAERAGLPLTAGKLEALGADDLLACLAPASADEEAIAKALGCLSGDGPGGPMPVAQSYQEGDMPGSLRVAIASNSGEVLNGHFGSCERFLIYQVSTDDSRLVAVRATAETENAEDKNVARANLIGDCDLVYVQSIGGPAAAKVVRAGVHPVKLPAGGPAAETLSRLQTSMHSPPPWLARAMGVEAASLARFVEAAES